MKELSNQSVVILLAATLLISLGSTIYTLNIIKNLQQYGFGGITGYATDPGGNLSVTISDTNSLKFNTASFNLGTVSVNTSGGYTNCSIVTNKSLAGCSLTTPITASYTPFVLENDGNTNLSIQLQMNVTGPDFLREAGAFFGWNVTVNESGSCRNSTAGAATTYDGTVSPNTTGCNPPLTSTDACGNYSCGGEVCGYQYENVTRQNKIICPRLLYTDTSDTLLINFNITIPAASPAGQRDARITATGTRVPTS